MARKVVCQGHWSVGKLARMPGKGRDKLGMAGQAEIVIGRETILSLLVKKIRQTISLG